MLMKKNVKMIPMISNYRILGCPIVKSPTIDELDHFIQSRISKGRGFYTVAINAEKVTLFNRDPLMKEVLENSDLPYADGSGALLGLKLLHNISTFKINMPVTILEICNRTEMPLYLIGAAEDVIEETVSSIKTNYDSINLVGYSHGFFEDEQEIINQIENTGASIVMIAMGSPRQEFLAQRMLKQMPDRVFVGCGGAFDILAGRVVRAPQWIQNAHIEWLYRLFQDPRRIKRQKVLPLFFIRLLILYIRRK